MHALESISVGGRALRFVHVRVLVDGVHRYGSEPCRCLHIGIWASVSIKGY